MIICMLIIHTFFSLVISWENVVQLFGLQQHSKILGLLQVWPVYLLQNIWQMLVTNLYYWKQEMFWVERLFHCIHPNVAKLVHISSDIFIAG